MNGDSMETFSTLKYVNGAFVIACPTSFGLGFDGSFDSDFLTEQ